MLIHLAAIGGVPGAVSARSVFMELYRADTFGVHHVSDDPERADAVLFVDLHQQPADPLARSLLNHPLVKRPVAPVFVYDERDFPSLTLPGIYVSGRACWQHRLPVLGGPYPLLHSSLTPSRRAPDLLFSFRGSPTHRVRRALAGVRHPRGVIELCHGAGVVSAQAQDRYAELVARSKFVLCPRGHGPSSFRIFETLAAGRVPVIISDDWLAPPRLPWERCAIRVAERQVGEIPQILESFESEWEQRASSALAEQLSRVVAAPG